MSDVVASRVQVIDMAETLLLIQVTNDGKARIQSTFHNPELALAILDQIRAGIGTTDPVMGRFE